ncbi:MAG: hypothetical protein F6J97_01650 [Leptolyngbya sp. SIO4C1]|nr:hypothetical protein [Leptolyngbya sp. SIO4C1]
MTASTDSSPASDGWHIAKAQSGQCQIVTAAELANLAESDKQETWGPFANQGEAVARRVGLIRAGKCQPS